MSYYRHKSVTAFAIVSFATSLLVSLMVFSAQFNVVIPIVLFATLFASVFGFALGGYFPFTGRHASYKAILLGMCITALTFACTFAVIEAMLLISEKGISVLLENRTYSRILLAIGVTSSFGMPVVLPIGAFTGYYVNTPPEQCNPDD